jgi:Cys-rich four helix bundle protein (predicted Tat secretion target)
MRKSDAASLSRDRLDDRPATRRSLVLGAGMLAAGLSMVLAGRSLAQAPNITPAATKKTPAAKPKVKKAEPTPGPNQALVDAAKRCGRVGDVCLKHCQRLTRAGDKSIADCMRAVQAMLPVCSAMAQLGAQNAARMKELARVCADICADCEAECRKHEFHHVECRNCAQACAGMIQACRAVIGA